MDLDRISFDDFAKVKIAVGKVLECENIEWSDKLYKLLVQFGDEKRTILSGIAKYYLPADLIDKKFVFVINLENKKIKDLESEGMILACDGPDGKAVLVSPIDDVVDGSLLH